MFNFQLFQKQLKCKMIALNPTSASSLATFLEGQSKLAFTYAQVGATKTPHPVAQFDNDQIRVHLGNGDFTFAQAKKAIDELQMFPNGWTVPLPKQILIQKGTLIALHARFLGVWWRNVCRIVYVVDEPKRFGFAYGTLPGHIERGEELFLIEIDKQGDVWYEIRAFSKPRHWLAKVGYPLVRMLQARFRRDSTQQMIAQCK